MFQAPHQTGQIRPLSPIKGMQLIHHQVTQGARLVVTPQRLINRPHQQIIQHLVVSQQNIGGVLPERVLTGNDRVCPHPLAGELLAITNEQADGHLAMQLRIAGNRLGKTAGLIGGQRIHRIDNNGLDPAPWRACAVVEQGVHKTLGFPRASAGGHQRRLWLGCP